MKPATMYTGNPPAPEDDPLLADVVEVDGIRWEIYLRRAKTTARHLNFKIAAQTEVPTKANYWVGWDRKRRELALVRDARLLAQNEQRMPLRLAVAQIATDYEAQQRANPVADLV